MSPVLVDTSVWIDYLNGNSTAASNELGVALQNEELILICPTIIQEILQGVKFDSDYEIVKNNLLKLYLLEINEVEVAVNAASLYRSLRKKGITIRKSADCLIASYAIDYNVQILHNDSDFDSIAQHSSLIIHPLSKK